MRKIVLLGVVLVAVVLFVLVGGVTVKPLLTYPQASPFFYWNYTPLNLIAARNYYHVLSSFFSIWTSIFGILLGVYYFYTKNRIDASIKQHESLKLLAKELLALLKEAHFDIMPLTRGDFTTSPSALQKIKDKIEFFYTSYTDTIEIMTSEAVIKEQNGFVLLRVYSVVDRFVINPPCGVVLEGETVDLFLGDYTKSLMDARRLLATMVVKPPTS